jgi:predicted RNA-binding Zn-ribbon protein involved in translation (DUF1610 family)
MPTRKIADETKPCSHPEHDPPNMRLFENGLWEHICPACGHRQVFRVSKPTYASGDVKWEALKSGAVARFTASRMPRDQR